jgi:Domain of unknown function (DUF5666)
MSGSTDQPPQPAAPATEPVALPPPPVAPAAQPAMPRASGTDLRPIAIGVGAALLVLLVAGIAFSAARLGALGTTSRDQRPGPVAQNPGPGNSPRDLRPGGPGGNERGPVDLRRRALQGDRDFGGPGGLIGLRQITISTISGSDLTVTTTDGWTRTINVGATTTITRAGQTIGVGDLKVGDAIRFQQQPNADGTFTITAIEVVLPRVTGQVSATTSDTITIQRQDGTTMTIHIGSDTTYRVPGIDNATLSDIKPGMVILAQGTQNADGSLQAVAVSAAFKR